MLPNHTLASYKTLGSFQTAITPIRLTRLQLTRLLLRELWRNILFHLVSSYSAMAGKYSRFVENIGIIRETIAPIRLSRWQLTKSFLAELWRDAGLFTRIASVLLGVTILAMILDRLIRPKSLETLGIPVGGSSSGTKMNFQQMLEDSKAKVCQALS